MYEFAMDLGTSSVLVYRQGKGIMLREPSVVAIRRQSGQVVSVGQKARDMLGRTPETLLAVRPVRGGVITDCEITSVMARTFLKRAGAGSMLRPNLLICVPPLVSELEERAVVDAGLQAGASKVYLMEQPIAAAAGAGVDPNSPKGTLVVDIGGGTTDIAVISMGAVVRAVSIRIAGDDYPAEVVRARLLKLNSSHIEYVLDRMRENTTYVRNIKKYLLAALYNAPATIDSYYTSLVSHDLYGSGDRR